MTDLLLLATDLLTKQLSEPAPIQVQPAPVAYQLNNGTPSVQSPLASIATPSGGPPEPMLPPLGEASRYLPHLSQEQSPEPGNSNSPTSSRHISNPILHMRIAPKPVSGPQLYRQRLAALGSGRVYTNLPPHSFWSHWTSATEQPSYQDWKSLLAQEARAIAFGQGSNRLGVLLGDSISMWFPCEGLPKGRLWLNQGISGDTTAGILSRLDAFSQTRPDIIYVMAGINDLRRGKSDRHVLTNLQRIMGQLREQHPQARIAVQSILPTRLASIPNSRIRHLNQEIAAIAGREGAFYLDIHSWFTNPEGNLRRDLTTDGLHLNPEGYSVWQWALMRAESWMALNPTI